MRVVNYHVISKGAASPSLKIMKLKAVLDSIDDFRAVNVFLLRRKLFQLILE